MVEIRSTSPGLTGTAQAPLRPASGARADAQRAFFQQALGQTQAQPAATPVVAAKPQAQTPAPVVTRVVEQPIEGQPQRYLRPGSLLDIKV